MRWLLYFTLGFSGSCIYCAYLGSENVWLYPILILLLMASLWINAKSFRIISMLLVGLAAGQLWYGCYEKFYLKDAEALDGVIQHTQIRACDYSEPTAYGLSVDGSIVLGKKFYQVRTYLDEMDPIHPGQLLTGDFRFRLTTANGAQEATSHPGKGIFLLVYQQGDITIEEGEAKLWDVPAKLRKQIKEILALYFPEDVFPFSKALLLGDTTDLDYGVDTDLKISGIRHMAAVSGLHVSILFAMISALTLRRRFLTALLGLPALLLFAALAGFTPSVTRSCLMCALMLLALLVNREYDGPTALSFAVLVILIVNPLAVTSVSLQLSVASVAGIYLFQRRILVWLQSLFRDIKGKSLRVRLIRWLTGSVSITLSAMTITTPLCAWYFGMVSLVSIWTNLLALWVISGIFYGILSTCVLHMILPSLAEFMAGLVAYPIRYVLWTAHVMAELPMSAVYTCSPYIIVWLVFLGLLLVVFLLSAKRRPVVFACCAALGLCVALLAGWAEIILDDVRFTVLDVGQGQCLLFQTEGKTVLVDCGGDRDTEAADIAAEAVLSQGIDHLDVMVLTHLDQDHAAGAEHLLSRLDVELLVMPNMYNEMNTGKAKQVVYAYSDLELALEEARMQVYSPGFPGNGNEMSLCVLFDTKICDILITGDRSGFGERMLLRNAVLPDVDILVAGHHGAESSTCEELLRSVRPEIVCISAGAGNPHGHPAPELLKRLNQYGCEVYRTDVQGTITIRR